MYASCYPCTTSSAIWQEVVTYRQQGSINTWEWQRGYWIMNWNGCGRKRSDAYVKVYCPGFCMQGLWETAKNRNQSGRCLGRDLNPGPLKYDAEILTARSDRRNKTCTLFLQVEETLNRKKKKILNWNPLSEDRFHLVTKPVYWLSR